MLFKNLKDELKKPNRRRWLNLIDDLRAIGSGFDLNRLGKIYRTDKNIGHYYTPHYRNHFKRFKFKRIRLLEIGVGGYKDPYLGGNSLRMWKKYFPLAKIYAIDIYDKSTLEENRIKIFKGSQTDEKFLEEVIEQTGYLDIVIDDGSHVNADVIKTFKLLFLALKDGGIYVIEDTQTSYWESYGGDGLDLKNPKTMMNFFKKLPDFLNYREYTENDYLPNYMERKVASVHFYHNLIFIYKGDNLEKSNISPDKR